MGTTTTTTTTTATTTTTTTTITTTTSKEFDVYPELKLEKTFKNSISIKKRLSQMRTLGTIEASSDDVSLIDTHDKHAFIGAARIAHSFHVPLCLSPDHIWTLIIQGFGEHMDIH